MKHFIALLLLTLSISGCATSSTHTVTDDGHRIAALPETASGDEESLGWRRIMFQHQWNADDEPDWTLDLLIAGELLAPAMDQHHERLPLWRFHRRNAHDSAGHQLSLLLYTDAATAQAIYQQIINQPLTTQLLAEQHGAEGKTGGLLKRIHHRGMTGNPSPLIENTSDPSWSLEMQRAWPYYIKGISEMWLSLLMQYRQQAAITGNLDEVLVDYQALNQRLTETWQKEGQHALLHHLNATFGYQPMLIRY